MSEEIPVGSPPVPPGRHAAPGGWYADPARAGQERYWDGWNWTRNVRPAEQATGQTPGQTYAQPGQTYHGQAQQGGWGAQGQPGAYAPQTWGPVLPATADGVPLAGWWFRVLALLIDLILLMVVNQIVSSVTGWGAAINAASLEFMNYIQSAGSDLDFSRAMNILMIPEQWYLTIASALTFIAYSALMLRFKGATLGKLAAGLRVVPVGKGRESNGVSWGRAIARPVVYELIGQVFGPLQLLNLLWPLWDRDKQALHDKVARTQVVRVR